MLSFNNEKHNLILERIESRLFYKLFVDRDGIGCVDSSDKDLKEADEEFRNVFKEPCSGDPAVRITNY